MTIIFFGACDRNVPEKEYLVSSVETKDIRVNLSCLLSSYKLVPLETHPDGLIGSIQKIIKHHGHYFLYTDRQRLLEFDEDGRFIRQISRQGSGPGEYTFINDFDVTEQQIAILEYNKIHYFDLGGKYLRTVRLAQGTSYFKLLPDGNALIKTDRNYGLRLINRDGKLKKNFLEMNKALTVGQEFGFYQTDSLIFYFSGIASNIIWQYDLSSGKENNIPIIDLADGISPEEEEDILTDQGFDYPFINSSNTKIRHISVAGEYLISYVYKTEANASIYFCHLPTKTATSYLVKNITDDILFRRSPMSISFSMQGQSRNSFISYVYPYEIEGGLEEYKDRATYRNYQSLRQILDTLYHGEDEPNPVLFEFVLK